MESYLAVLSFSHVASEFAVPVVSSQNEPISVVLSKSVATSVSDAINERELASVSPSVAPESTIVAFSVGKLASASVAFRDRSVFSDVELFGSEVAASDSVFHSKLVNDGEERSGKAGEDVETGGALEPSSSLVEDASLSGDFSVAFCDDSVKSRLESVVDVFSKEGWSGGRVEDE